MPRPAKLPDLTNVDITELRLAILCVLDQHHCGPEFRRIMRGAQLGDMFDQCGGPKAVLQAALEVIRRGR
jgi:hypothetical protein